MRKRVYISGPMTGRPDLNKPEFQRAASLIAAAGCEPVNPHDLCQFDWDWHRCMRADVAALCNCDAILMIDGWQHSNGAQLEVHVAHRIGLRVLLSFAELREWARRQP